MNNKQDLHEGWRIKSASRKLVIQASSISAQHIKDPGIRTKLIKWYDSQANQLYRMYESGIKSAQETIDELNKETFNLTKQHQVIIQKGVGIYASLGQIYGGITITAASEGSLAYYGVPLALHGINNLYENGAYFITGNDKIVGPVRLLYEFAAEYYGFDKEYADIAYYSVDSSISLYGLFGRTAIDPKALQLFRYISEDFCRGIETMSKAALGLELYGNKNNISSIAKEYNNAQ